MGQIANVALSNTFDTWRQRHNQTSARLNQFAINENILYANTIIANNVFKSPGNTVLGAAGKRAIVNGLLSANGRATIGTNLAVSGNTTSNKLVVTASVTGTAANATYNKVTITSQATVSGNSTFGSGSANTVQNLSGSRLTNYCEFANTSISSNTAQTISTATNVVRYRLSGNMTCTLPSGMPLAAPAVKTIVIFVRQDAIGSRTFTLAAPAGESIVWNNSGSAPAAVTGANKVTIYTCLKFDGDSRWYASQSFLEA